MSSWGVEGHQLTPDSGREETGKPLTVALFKNSQKNPHWIVSTRPQLRSQGMELLSFPSFGSTGFTQAPSGIRSCDASPRMSFPQGWQRCLPQLLCQVSRGKETRGAKRDE